MRQPKFIIRLALALIVLVTGCAAPTTEAGSVLTQPGDSRSANGVDLKGTWRGSFGQVFTGDSGEIHGDIVCQIQRRRGVQDNLGHADGSGIVSGRKT